jgi:hypothetical protein
MNEEGERNCKNNLYKTEYTNTQNLAKDSDRMIDENTKIKLPTPSRRRRNS